MYTLIGSALIGAFLASRSKPKTRCEKKALLGPKTGATYQVEDFVDAGFLVVTAADGSHGIFMRSSARPEGGAGVVWQHGRGNPETLRAIYLDLLGEPPKPKAVPEPAATPGSAPRPPKTHAHRGTP